MATTDVHDCPRCSGLGRLTDMKPVRFGKPLELPPQCPVWRDRRSADQANPSKRPFQIEGGGGKKDQAPHGRMTKEATIVSGPPAPPGF